MTLSYASFTLTLSSPSLFYSSLSLSPTCRKLFDVKIRKKKRTQEKKEELTSFVNRWAIFGEWSSCCSAIAGHYILRNQEYLVKGQ